MKLQRIDWLIIAATARMLVSAAQPYSTEAGLVPRPAHIEWRVGDWTLQRTTRLVAGGDAFQEGDRLAEALSGPLGWRMPVVNGPARAGDIEMVLADPDAALGTEGYRLSVSPDHVLLTAGAEAGLFYGGVTFRQLLPSEVFGRKVTGSKQAILLAAAPDSGDNPLTW